MAVTKKSSPTKLSTILALFAEQVKKRHGLQCGSGASLPSPTLRN
ncbi:MAG TPA: hypothetical protein VK186_11625 [Candidatus Deferrimicrobium sp.]|nr:hypothetical protein [Candidatus Deferrimicrobium sp.]